MLRFASASALLILAPVVSAQEAPQLGDDGVYEVAEVQPALVGGLAGLHERLVYPEAARTEGVEGMVVLQFVVDEEGAVVDPAVLRTPDDRLAEAALTAVEGSTFTPGRVGERAVPVRFALPVSFRLGDGEGTEARSERRGRSVFWDTEFSDNVDALVDRRASSQAGLRARVMGRVAYGGEAFEGLAPGSAAVRFTVSPEGRATEIEISEASSPVVERFARFQMLAVRFAPEAVGEEATATVTVTRVGR
ncbi:MAG: energy transducer TonB [Bacteroidota bacterium]